MKHFSLLHRPVCTIALTACVTGLLAPSSPAQSTTSRQVLQGLTAEQQEILSHQSIVYQSDGQGGTVKTLRIEGINVQVVDGTGTTDGTPTGHGNLIVGYNELRGSSDNRTGSHNIVGGRKNNFSDFGGLVAGELNEVNAPWASVTGGSTNTASASWSSVSGGSDNTASGESSSVSGGSDNTASGDFSSVSGGWTNLASSWYCSVSGGRNAVASASGSR